MKRFLLLATVFLAVIASSCVREHQPESIKLTDPWKFRTGDNREWSSISFNDSSWGMIDPTKIWEAQGYDKYDGIAWYRMKIVIPSKLKEHAGKNDSLQIFLGKIDDCDQVFFNGELIGENGRSVAGMVTDSGFTKVEGIWNLERRYPLSLGDSRIKWDAENLIAVRCFDGDGAGGMYSDKFELAMTGLKDRVKFDLATHPFILDDSLVTKKIVIKNISATEEFNGNLTIRVSDCKTGISQFIEKSGIMLTPGAKLDKTVCFKRKPATPVTLFVEFQESATSGSITAKAEVPYILTPIPSEFPRINGAKVFGVRPYSPFLFKVAATGKKPVRYFAEGLPSGLMINESNGVITGMLKKKGEHKVKIRVENDLGYTERDLTIVVGELISLTPPMGWNSWNCWGLSVSDAKVRKSASEMVSSGLIDHGWTYINIDDGWEDTHDRNGNILTNAKFPDMRGLGDYVHSLGLKIGIYSSPGTKTCGGYEGSFGFEEKDAQAYAGWGIDYLKYDWCSCYRIAPDPTIEQMKKPYKEMRHALRKTNRDIHYSLCQYGMGDVWKWGAEVDGNSWRTTGDITDTWESLTSIGFSQNPAAAWAAPGRWNDPDMLVVGWVGWGPSLHYTRLTPSEQYTHITLWSLLASPLLIGCDLAQLDPFTLNLLTNDDVLDVNQDPLGQQAVQVYKTAAYEIWARDLSDGRKAVGLFNKTDKPLNIPVEMKSLCLRGIWHLRDLWSQTNLGKVRVHFEMRTEPHGSRFIALSGI